MIINQCFVVAALMSPSLAPVTIETEHPGLENELKHGPTKFASMTESSTSARDMANLLIDTFDGLAEGLAVYDADERLVFCNADFRRQLEPVAHMLEPGTQWRDILQACIENGLALGLREVEGDWRKECDVLRELTSPRTSVRELNGQYFDLSFNPMKNGGFFITRANVTERVAAERRLREREELLTTVFDTNPTPVIMARIEDSKIVYLSPAAREFYGDAEYGSSYYTSAEDRARYIADLQKHGQVRDRRFDARAADGTPRQVSVTGGLTNYNGEPCVVSSVTDLTTTLEREALIRLVVEACPAPILMIRAETGEILFRSQKAIELYGETESAKDFYVSETDRDGFLGEVRRHRDVSDYRLRLKNASGEPFWCAVSARLIQWGGEDVIVSHSRDLTGQLSIEAELARQREQAFQNEKMSALGSLLAGVAHELNNPLSVVVGHAMMLADEAEDPSVLRQTKKIRDAAERCSKIVRTFLTMAREEPVRMEMMNLREVVETAVEVARYGDTGSTVQIKTVVDHDLPDVCGDADQITQAIVNLILNAEQAIVASGRAGTVTVRAELDREQDKLRLVVEDDGPGIPDDIRARVFEPFFTTKGVGQGTGIGLAVCHRVVAAHGGSIALETAHPQGTRFTILLPFEQKTRKTNRQVKAPVEANPVIRVLVIDDEVEVADLNVEVLQRGGFDAKAVYRAEDAFDILRSGNYDVVLSDLNMPDVDGRAVFDRISAEFPELLQRTGFVTGDTMGRASQKFLSEAKRPYLEKPVSPQELRAFVARLSSEGTSA